MNDHSATRITVDYTTFRAMERELERLRAAEGAARTAPKLPPDEAVQRLTEALNHALPVVQFAVGNLPPHTHRGWPAADLALLAASLGDILPDHPDIDSLIQAFREFVREVNQIQGERDARLEAAMAILAKTSTEETHD